MTRLRTTLILLVSLLSGCASSDKINAIKIHTQDNQNYYIAYCSILNSNFEIIRRLSPDRVCTPTADGGWLAESLDTLTRYSADGTVLWEQEGVYHHQIRQLDEKSIVVLYAHLEKVGDDLVKFDSVRKISLETGEILKEFSLYDFFFKNRESKKLPAEVKLVYHSKDVANTFPQAHLENTHLNSISFSGGFIVVSSSSRLTFALDQNLNFDHFINHYRNAFHFTRGDSSEEVKHDLQFLPSHTMLVFKNSNYDKTNKKSTFKFFEISEKGKVFEFPTEKSDYVFCPHSGGVEKLDSGYLVGFPYDNAKNSIVGLVSFEGKWLIKKTIPFNIQDIKKIPFKDYITLNKIK